MMRLLLILLYVCLIPCSHAQSLLDHQLSITLYPNQHNLKAEDRISLPSGSPRTLRFTLHRGLHPVSPDAVIELIGRSSQDWMLRYRVALPPGKDSFTMRYAGTIFHPPQQDVREARNFKSSPGIISAEGVMLSGSSGWYPNFENAPDNGMMTFSLDVALPRGWRAISQGKRMPASAELEERTAKTTWQEKQPQDEIYLIAAAYFQYLGKVGDIETLVYLRNADAALAQRYQDATSNYLEMYQKLIGDYPYAKFALVENFWETGYGMPSFTLMGSQVIRLPFIIDTSYPHEILHNWWGNGVYVDYQSGNWSEGLTAYLADHLLQEQKGNGAEYRRGVLQKYTDFVSAGRDFPLNQFVSRHSAQSEAVGYGKAMMLFHMLRRRMGDEKFTQALQNLYQKFKFKRANYTDIKNAFEKVAEDDLGQFFVQWVQQTGAPELHLASAVAERTDKGYELIVNINQIQSGSPYMLDLPIAITLAGAEGAYSTLLRMSDKQAEWKLSFVEQPLRVDVDPEFDVFRRLDRSEVPPALSQVFGAEQLLIVLPREASEDMRAQYLATAKKWQQQPGRSTNIVWDDEIEAIPTFGAVWLFGWVNHWREEFQSALGDATLSDQGVRIGDASFLRSSHALALTAKVANTSVAWLAVPEAKMMQTLARKLPHYSKYSYAVFEGENLTNIVKGIWPLTTSSLAMPVRHADGSPQKVNRGKLQPNNSLMP